MLMARVGGRVGERGEARLCIGQTGAGLAVVPSAGSHEGKGLSVGCGGGEMQEVPAFRSYC